MSTPTHSPFLFGSVVGRGFAILYRNAVPFGTISVMLVIPLAAVSAMQEMGYLPARTVGTAVLQFIVAFILPQVMMAAIVFGSFQDIRGQKISVGDAIAGGVQMVMPVLGVVIVTGVAIGISAAPMLGAMLINMGGVQILLALALLALPIYLSVLFFVAVPACVIEKKGVGNAIRRSIMLSEGARWRVLGIMVIVWLIGIGVLLLLTAIGIALTLAGSVLGAPVLTALAFAFYYALNATMATVAYHDLRVSKEGIGTDVVARVFD